MQVDPTKPVEQVVRTICETLGIQPEQLGGDVKKGFSLTLQSEDEQSTELLMHFTKTDCLTIFSAALNPKKALRGQKNWRKSVLVLKTVTKGDAIVREDKEKESDAEQEAESKHDACSVIYAESDPTEIEVSSSVLQVRVLAGTGNLY